MRSLLLLAAVASAAIAGNPPPAAYSPNVQRTYRDIEVPRPPVTVRRYVPVDEQVEQPPQRFREVTETRTYTVPLDHPALSPVTYHTTKAKAYAPLPAARYVAAPVRYVPSPALYIAAPLRYGDKIGPGLYNTPTGRPAAPGVIAVPGAPFPLDGPIRRGIRAGLGFDPG